MEAYRKMGELIEKYQAALQNEDYSLMQEIVSELNSVTPSKKSALRELYIQIGDDLFERSVELPNYSVSDFDASIQDSLKRKTIERAEKIGSKFQDNVDEILLSLYNNSESILPNLKSHFVLTLQNHNTSVASLLILTGHDCSNYPLVENLLVQNKGLNPIKKNLSDFISECEKNTSMLDNRYVCFLVIISKLVFEEEEGQLIKKLIGLFKTSNVLKLKKCIKVSADDFKWDPIDSEFYEDVQTICGKVFNNRDISFEEERIIKKFFPENSPVLDYKLLKGGFSGAKVAEVQPNKRSFRQEPRRFIIKYGTKDGLRKIKNESKAFKKYISEYSNQYQCEYIETAQCEAIRYSYASSDSIKNSHQFAELINLFLSDKKIDFNLCEVVTDIFTCEPFEIWKSSNEHEKKQLGDLYKIYLDERKILENISRIENKSVNDVKSSALWKNYLKILQHKLKINNKVCHGDLHTENIFKDDDGAFLIDFGYTEYAHAVLDHATLEASIKFKHVPFYIDISDLLSYDEKLVNIASFEANYDLHFIDRQKLKDLYRLILLIRQDAKQFFVETDNCLEYFVSLFFITFRQVQYKDLNQRYALFSAKWLAEYIVQKLSL